MPPTKIATSATSPRTPPRTVGSARPESRCGLVWVELMVLMGFLFREPDGRRGARESAPGLERPGAVVGVGRLLRAVAGECGLGVGRPGGQTVLGARDPREPPR